MFKLENEPSSLGVMFSQSFLYSNMYIVLMTKMTFSEPQIVVYSYKTSRQLVSLRPVSLDPRRISFVIVSCQNLVEECRY